MFRRVFLAFFVVSSLFIVSCSTSRDLGSVGQLPDNWWQQPRGYIENVLRSESQGYYSNVLVFVGESDSVKNYSESQALAHAKLDANAKLSEYIISKTTTIVRDSVETVLSRETGGEADEELTRSVNEISNMMASSISVSQFSSFMIEGSHTELDEQSGIKYYRGWVCCTIQDDIVKEIQAIQKEAFNSVIENTQAYAPMMKKIQDDVSNQIAAVMLNDLKGISVE
jgi:hypothetical protein